MLDRVIGYVIARTLRLDGSSLPNRYIFALRRLNVTARVFHFEMIFPDFSVRSAPSFFDFFQAEWRRMIDKVIRFVQVERLEHFVRALFCFHRNESFVLDDRRRANHRRNGKAYSLYNLKPPSVSRPKWLSAVVPSRDL